MIVELDGDNAWGAYPEAEAARLFYCQLEQETELETVTHCEYLKGNP